MNEPSVPALYLTGTDTAKHPLLCLKMWQEASGNPQRAYI